MNIFSILILYMINVQQFQVELVASSWECQYADQGSQVLTTLPDFPYRLNISTTLNFCFLHVLLSSCVCVS